MSYPQRSATGSVANGAKQVSKVQQDWSARPERRPQRAAPLARRYEAAFLARNGEIDSFSRLAPATVAFEQAFSAFSHGTPILTEAGAIPVEDLLPGTRVVTAEGRSEMLTWSGSMILYPEAATLGLEDEDDTRSPPRLTRITAEALGLRRPQNDVVLGPHARLLHQDPRLRPLLGRETGYVPASALQDGISVIEVAPITPVTVHHLVLEHPGTLIASGLPVESFHPGTGFAAMSDPALVALFLSLFPQMPGIEAFGIPLHPHLSRSEAEAMLIG